LEVKKDGMGTDLPGPNNKSTMENRMRVASLWIIVAAAYYGAAWLGLQMAVFPEMASPIRPAAGVAVATLTLLGLRAWPAIASTVFLVELPGLGFTNSLMLTVGTTGEAGLGAFIVRRLGAQSTWLVQIELDYFSSEWPPHQF
jgi:integral membrane sensor domain MASE1